MHVVAEFRRYALECRHTAAATRNKQDKDQWNQLAERWLRCAENLERQEATRDPARRRKGRLIRPRQAA